MKLVFLLEVLNMAKCIDLTGMRFHELKVIERADNIGAQTAWLCECSCGKRKVVMSCHLKNGNVRSCGHLISQNVRKANTRHGMFNTRLYKIFDSMKQRCYNPNSTSYHNYGGRGITICDEWLNDPSAFFKWSLENGYSDDLTIDRKDNDKGYSPENCRWTTEIEQHNNTRRNRYVEYKGEVHTLSEWCRILGLNYSTVKTRLNVLKWSVEEAFER